MALVHGRSAASLANSTGAYTEALATFCGIAPERVTLALSAATPADLAAAAASSSSSPAGGGVQRRQRQLTSSARSRRDLTSSVRARHELTSSTRSRRELTSSPSSSTRVRAQLRAPPGMEAAIVRLLESQPANVSAALARAIGLHSAANISYVRTTLEPGVVPRPEPPPPPSPPPLPRPPPPPAPPPHIPSDGSYPVDGVSSTLPNMDDSGSIGSSWLRWTQVLKTTLVLMATGLRPDCDLIATGLRPDCDLIAT